MHEPQLEQAEWVKSTHSSAEGENCVEVALNIPGAVLVRDSKNPEGGVIAVSPGQWRTFTHMVRA